MDHDLPGQETENRKILPSASGRTYFTVHNHGVGPGAKIVFFFNSTIGIIDQILGLVTALSAVKSSEYAEATSRLEAHERPRSCWRAPDKPAYSCQPLGT
jgi:hypothetical protein